MSSSAFISLLVSRFSSRPLRSRSLLLTGERGLRQSLRWRQVLRFLIFIAVLLTDLPLWWVSSPTMSREDSLTTVVLWFTGWLPDEPPSGYRRISHIIDSVRVPQLLMEFRSNRTSFHFPSPASETTNQAWVTPLHSYDASLLDNSNLKLSLIESSSLSSPLSEFSSSPVCPLFNGGSAHLSRPSLSPSDFDGNTSRYNEHVSPPASAIYLSSGVIRITSDLQPRSTMSRFFPAYAFVSGLRIITKWPTCAFAYGLRSITNWAWPFSFAEASNAIIKIQTPRLPNQEEKYLAVGLNSLDNLKTSVGFMGVYNLSLLQYHFFMKNLSSSSSSEESTSPYFPSMNGDFLLGFILSICFNFFTGLLPCVAVCTGPEGAIEITLVFLVGEGCPSTSFVTIFQLSDFVVKVLPTHSSFVLNPLSVSYEDLSCLISILLVVYELFPRGCLIPSCCCNP